MVDKRYRGIARTGEALREKYAHLPPVVRVYATTFDQCGDIACEILDRYEQDETGHATGVSQDDTEQLMRLLLVRKYIEVRTERELHRKYSKALMAAAKQLRNSVPPGVTLH